MCVCAARSIGPPPNSLGNRAFRGRVRPKEATMLTARAMLAAIPIMCAAQASAQSTLYGIQANGDLVRIDKATGAGEIVGSSGFGCNAAAADAAGHILIGAGSAVQADQIIALDPATGAGSVFLNIVGRPFGFGIRGMAIHPSGVMYVVLSSADTTVIDRFGSIDMTTGVFT